LRLGSEFMKIVVVGAGAMGSLFGGFLAAAGEEVCLVDVWAEHVGAINKEGLRILTSAGEKTVKVRAVTSFPQDADPDLVIIFVKSSFTEEAAGECAKFIRSDTMVLTLQNGLDNVGKICQVLGKDRVIAGTSTEGATVLGPGFVKHAGVGETHVGELDGGQTPRIKTLEAALNRAGFNTDVTHNVMGLIWGKLLINVGINALTAITGLKNGQLLEAPELAELMAMAVTEAAAVAKRENVQLDFADPVAKVRAVAKATAENKSSMLQDMERGRKTEIDAINGAVVATADNAGVEAPVNKVLTLLVKALEQQVRV
jgi:2-dehydropantoate 2-reductase